MRLRLRYTRSARNDLVELARFIHRGGASVDTARRFIGELDEKCRDLAASPFAILGRARPELRSDIRSLVHGNYVIFFRYLPGTVEIVTIVEGHLDLDALFRDDA